MLVLLLSGVVDDIRRMYDTVRTFQADIVQEVKFGNLVVYKGKVYLKKPDFFRWELTEPEEYVIVARGDSSWVKYRGEIYSQPVPYDLKSLLMGDYSSLNVEEKRRDGRWALKITSEKVGYDSLLVFLRENLLPERIEAFQDENYIKITLKDPQVNVEIPDSLFKLSVP